jgi:hypothetical protein
MKPLPVASCPDPKTSKISSRLSSPNRKVAVLQSNYLPWKGYFDIIHDVDLFIFYDDVQFTKNDWRNRNKIKTQNGAEWITIPTGSDSGKKIYEIPLPSNNWNVKHWKSIQHNYAKAPYFSLYADAIHSGLLKAGVTTLSELNQYLIKTIAIQILRIPVEFVDSRSFKLSGDGQDRLLDLLLQVGCNTYVSGPSGRNYMSPKAFDEAGIHLEYKDYSGYPNYIQQFPPFDHHVSIIDLLFNTGNDAAYYIWRWRDAYAKPVPI